jgi:hypothetical protein
MRRVPLAALLGFIAVIAVGLAALRSGTGLWAGLIYTLMIGYLLAGLLGTILRGRRGGAWVGLAVFGWGYLLAGHIPGLEGYHESLSDSVAGGVFTSANPEPPPNPPGTIGGSNTPYAMNLRTSEHIGYWLLVILFAQFGSLLGGLLAPSRGPRSPGEVPPRDPR